MQVSSGYKMVVLRSDPMAPEVASDIDSKSTPIFSFLYKNIMCMYTHIYMYIYIYRERERELERGDFRLVWWSVRENTSVSGHANKRAKEK